MKKAPEDDKSAEWISGALQNCTEHMIQQHGLEHTIELLQKRRDYLDTMLEYANSKTPGKMHG